jgi:hypothetical protein
MKPSSDIVAPAKTLPIRTLPSDRPVWAKAAHRALQESESRRLPERSMR